MSELPIVVLEIDDNDVDLDENWAVGLGLTVAARCDNLMRARKFIRKEAAPGCYLIVKKIEVKRVSFEPVTTRVVS